MPNHIKNKIELIGSESDIKNFVESFSTFFQTTPSIAHGGDHIYKGIGEYEYGWYDPNTTVFTRRNQDAVLGIPDGFTQKFDIEWTRFPDFEKVFPVPECIKAVGNSVSSNLTDAVYAKYKAPLSDNSLLASLQHLNRGKVTLRPEDEMQFELACKAYEETGFAYWYDYQCDKWGTKWNSYSCEKISDNIYTFETAWSGVLNIIHEMSLKFNGTILYKYADEDTGYNVGEFKIASGIILSQNRPQGGTKSAYELAFELRPDSKENYKLVNGTYEYIEDED